MSLNISLSFLDTIPIQFKADIERIENAIQKGEWNLVRQFANQFFDERKKDANEYMALEGVVGDFFSIALRFTQFLSVLSLQDKQEVKHSLAKVARLSLELDCLKLSKKEEEIDFDLQMQLLRPFSKLLDRQREMDVGCRYELKCCYKVLWLMGQLDAVQMFSKIAKFKPLEGFEKVEAERKEEWIYRAVYLNWRVLTLEQDPDALEMERAALLPSLHLVEVAQTAVGIWGELVLRGQVSMHRRLMEGEGGLVALATKKPALYFEENKKMWPVRYQALRILASLLNHPVTEIAEKVMDVLLESRLKESHALIQTCLKIHQKHPRLIDRWAAQYLKIKEECDNHYLPSEAGRKEYFARFDQKERIEPTSPLFKIAQKEDFLRELRGEVQSYHANAKALENLFKEHSSNLEPVYSSPPLFSPEPIKRKLERTPSPPSKEQKRDWIESPSSGSLFENSSNSQQHEHY